MSAAASAAFGVLWFGFMVLGGLVLLLYRQVDRAYSNEAGTEAPQLAPGAQAPDFKVIDQAGEVPFAFRTDDSLWLLLFGTTDCSLCRALLHDLGTAGTVGAPAGTVCEVVGALAGEATPEYLALLDMQSPAFRIIWLSHPSSVGELFGIRSVPSAYILQGRTIVAGGVVSDMADVVALIARAILAPSESDRRPSPATA